MQVTPAATYETIKAGPAVLLAASPVATKMPAPITAPTPRLVSVTGPSTRRRRCSPAISSSRTCRDFLAKSCLKLITIHRVVKAPAPERSCQDYQPPQQKGGQRISLPAHG